MQLGLHSGRWWRGPSGGAPQRPYTAVGEATQVALQPPAARGARDAVRQRGHLRPGAGGGRRAQRVAPSTCAGLSPAGADIHRARAAPAPGGCDAARRPGAAVALSDALGNWRCYRRSLAQVAQGQGQVIGIVGEPGMGKSRLLAEFRQRLAGQAVTYCDGHCLPYGQRDPVSAGA